MKIPNKRELQQIASNHSYDINFKDFMKLSEEYTKKPYSFLVNNITLPSDNPLRFRRDVLLKEVLVRKLKQLITKWIEPKFHTI